MSEREPLRPPPVEPMSDAAWSRVERGLWLRLDAAAPGSLVPPVPAEPPRRAPRWIWLAAPALAAAGSALALGLALRDAPRSPEGARMVSNDAPSELSYDDIHVTLEAHSAVVMNPSPCALLEEGAAWFTVPSRRGRAPFEVRAGEALVRVVGTRLRVGRAGKHTTVEVEHGAVEIVYHGTTTQLRDHERWSSHDPARVTASRAPDPTPPGASTGPGEAPGAVTSAATSAPPPPPPPASAGRAPARRPTAPAPDPHEEMFHYYEQIERSDPTAAVEGYLLLSRRRTKWAENALYAAGRLSADRGLPRARELLELYLARYPRGTNAKDAQLQLVRLAQPRP